MKELLETLATWEASGADVGRAVVVRTFGSAPRPEGAVLLYAADGRIAGSVSGGCVEGAAAEEIEHARETGHARVIRYGISDEQAWDVGLACGGTIDVLVEPILPAVGRAARRRPPSARVATGPRSITPLPADSPPSAFGPHEPGDGAPPEAELIVRDDGTLTGSLGSPPRMRPWSPPPPRRSSAACRGPSRSSDRSLFIEVFPVRPRLVVVGGVEVARSLVRLARELGFETVVVDGREAFATPERFPDVDRLVDRLAGRGRRRDRPGPERCGRRPVARREVRRAGDRRSASARLPVCRGRRLEEDPGRPSRAAARGGRERGGPGPSARPRRPGPGRPRSGRDGPRDPGRDRRGALRRFGSPDAATSIA